MNSECFIDKYAYDIHLLVSAGNESSTFPELAIEKWADDDNLTLNKT